jgi:CubicO group peptidase (beta-lactamase class C family)
MLRFVNWILGLPCAAVLVMALNASGQASVKVDWPKEIADAAQDLDFHGVILVQSHNRTIINRAFGGRPEQANINARYWIASISKSLSAVLVYRLQEKGLLRLQDTVARFFPDAPADKKSITLKQLLTHTSGLPNKYASEGFVDRNEAAGRILDLLLVRPPGEGFQYTNDGYSLLAAIAEGATGIPYGQLLKNVVLQPAGMSDTGLWPVCSGSPVIPLSETLPSGMNRENWGYKGPDGICSTSADLAKFMRALRAGRILQKNSLEAMWTGEVRISDGYAASGWFRMTSTVGSPIIDTRGTDHGHNSIIEYYPAHDLVLISLSSSQNPDGPLLARMLVKKLEEKLKL